MAQTTGEHPQVTGWYASFLENVVVPNAALLLPGDPRGDPGRDRPHPRAFTGIAAFFGVFMNASFLFAGMGPTRLWP